MKPFRILLLEDAIEAVVPLLTNKDYPEGNEYYFLTLLLKALAAQPEDKRVAVEVFWSQTLDFTQTFQVETGDDDRPYESENQSNSVFRLVPNAAQRNERMVLIRDKPELRAALAPIADIPSFLSSTDVMVLDLGGLAGKLPQLGLEQVNLMFTKANLQPPQELNTLLEKAKTSFPGVYFYFAYQDALQRCQFVVVLSAYDESSASRELPIRKLLHPFCGLVAHTPYTVKFGKTKVHTEAARATLHSRILCLYQDYCEGYTQLRHLGRIEEAAHHDLPVLIVGESGTGKEYVARSIHRRWLAERRRNDLQLADTFVVVNCAGLSPELARSELFGHVAGSFTGATDHRLGAILRACGCHGFKKTTDSERKKAEAAEVQAKNLCEALQTLSETPEAQMPRYVRSQVIPALMAAIENEQHSLVTLLTAIRKKLESAAYGDDLVQDYYTGLTGKNKTHLEPMLADGEQEYLGVKFKHDSPVGTLFLDEFGDLPPEVQNLLLRFLEEKSGEIQPVGYSGRIGGLKIRLILATSDPRIAKFAGYDLLGTHRSDQELRRSLRHDLLFRVKSQVIKTEAIASQTQLWNTLEEMIARHSKPTWTQAAKDYLAGEKGKITEILNALTSQSGDQHSGATVFGQRRELKRIIDLVNCYMDSAERRGLRMESAEVTERIVEDIWRPSELLMTTPSNRQGMEAAHLPSRLTRTYAPLEQHLSEEETRMRQAIVQVLGGDESLLNCVAFDKHVKSIAKLNPSARQELRRKLECAMGLDSSNAKARRAIVVMRGRIFNHPGGDKPLASVEDYIKQQDSWWNGQVFRNTESVKSASKQKGSKE